MLEDFDPAPTVDVAPPAFDLIGLVEYIFRTIVDWFPVIFTSSQKIVGLLVGISIPVSLFFFIVIVYCVEQLKVIRRKEELIYDTKVELAYIEEAQGDPTMARAWESVTRHIESPNQNDWKQAIIEADIMLDDILTNMGYQGESIGEKLKRVSPGDFKTLDDAWEAHKIRNQIAHETGFTLGQHEARMTIGRYRKVFEEFYYI